MAGNKSFEYWIGQLNSPDTQDRRAACRVLRESGDLRAVEPLIERLGDQDSYLRQLACQALGQMRDARAVEPLVQRLGDQDWAVRYAARSALGQFGDVGMVGLLVQRLGDESWYVRYAACSALGELGDVQAIGPLIERLGDETSGVRRAACEALERLGEERLAKAVVGAIEGETEAHEELARLAQEGDLRALDPLIQRLEDEDSGVRQAACGALGRLAHMRALEPLIQRLGDQTPGVRRAACQALARLGEGRLAEATVGAIEGEPRAYQELALLAQQGDTRAVGPLMQRFGDKDWTVRRSACRALGRLGVVRAVDPLIQRLTDQASGVRQAACEALGELGDLRAVQPLIKRLGDKDSDVQQAACQGLGELADMRAVEPVIQRLGDQSLGVRRAACEALARLGEGRMAEAVVGAIQGEPDVHLALARLAQEGDLRAVEPLIQRLGDRDRGVRRAVFRALESIGRSVKDPHQLLCRSCLARFLPQNRHFESLGTVSIPVCRRCGRMGVATPNVREVVAVLDTEMGEELSCADGVARVSYLKRDAPFDFDRVEIVRAGDYEVERFCVQVGNDADPFRRGRYRKMRCVVGPRCCLSENTLRILRSIFGKVEVRA